MAHFLNIQDRTEFMRSGLKPMNQTQLFVTEIVPDTAMPSVTTVAPTAEVEEPVQAGIGGVPLLLIAGLGLWAWFGKGKKRR